MQTDASGAFSLLLPEGKHVLRAAKAQYEPWQGEVTVAHNGAVLPPITLPMAVDHSYTFAPPHRLTLSWPGSSAKTLLDVHADHVRIAWTYHDMTEVGSRRASHSVRGSFRRRLRFARRRAVRRAPLGTFAARPADRHRPLRDRRRVAAFRVHWRARRHDRAGCRCQRRRQSAHDRGALPRRGRRPGLGLDPPRCDRRRLDRPATAIGCGFSPWARRTTCATRTWRRCCGNWGRARRREGWLVRPADAGVGRPARVPAARLVRGV